MFSTAYAETQHRELRREDTDQNAQQGNLFPSGNFEARSTGLAVYFCTQFNFALANPMRMSFNWKRMLKMLLGSNSTCPEPNGEAGG